MDTSIITTTISVLGGVLIASITYYLTKRNEEQTAWKNEKLKFYIEFINKLSGITDCEWSEKNVKSFANATNNLYLFAPINVITTMQKFLNETSASNKNKSTEMYTKTLTNLINEIRKDIKIKTNKKEKFEVLLRTSGINNE